MPPETYYIFKIAYLNINVHTKFKYFSKSSKNEDRKIIYFVVIHPNL
nr:MAG TPA: hypothetical protein [Caudoviricetes sp.]